jgi:predicted 3-demethylubiquinone-9 3-methyltransferase (glyoxalase superfamily)
MQKIVTFLWYNDNAEEAAKFYTSVFKNSSIRSVNRIQEGAVMSVTFEIEGQEFYALNGGPQFNFTPAISLFVNCYSQEEVDELWEKLSDGGSKERCGWLKDKFGLSWQIVPTRLGELLYSKDPIRAQNVMVALMQMNKLDINKLEQAYNKDI